MLLSVDIISNMFQFLDEKEQDLSHIQKLKYNYQQTSIETYLNLKQNLYVYVFVFVSVPCVHIMLPFHTEGVLEVGVDEAAIIGRVYAGAVIWPHDLVNPLVKDSKKYTKIQERERAYDYILDNAIAYGIGYVEPQTIDESNIYKAVMTAMHTAIQELAINPDHIIVDGNSFRPFMDQYGEFPSYTTVIGGDHKYYSIAPRYALRQRRT